MKRTPLRPKRRKPGVTGRQALPRAEWRALVADLTAHCRGRCENPWCDLPAVLDPHHVVKRSRGGPDHRDNVVMLCRRCHDMTDAAEKRPWGGGGYSRRISVDALGHEMFMFRRLYYYVDGYAFPQNSPYQR